MGGDVFNQHFLFVAKAAANARLNHSDALDRQTHHRSDLAANVKRHLGAGPNYQPVIRVPVGQGNMRFDVSLLHLGNNVFLLKDSICFSKTLIRVADINSNTGSQVAGWVRFVKIYVIWFVMNSGSIRMHGKTGVNDCWQLFVSHLD